MANLVESFLKNNTTLSYLEEWLLDKNLNKKHWAYFNLVDFVSPLYSNVKSQDLQSLAFASYGYFRAMLIVDHLIDDPKSKNGTDVFRFLQLNEACIKELSFLFTRGNNFWESFDTAKTVYFKTKSDIN